ncbi:MAG: efflux RND transporter periplasmic adaptor subunit [Haliscomenobacter sp.]|uniref:efflux RND transporter periplasmic adaptor subunit n=1 Tax=Haliscomenobacter sp. TaxID=2717303 RepID=UPI0029BD5B5C|nr:efflux RND transporter periplasmic adaptor subunit [Haliscomenobacter sp.]MDX2067790.1 efflux RND transporter periplasmic adaptor subunit [Haliscomenobacter sp.]
MKKSLLLLAALCYLLVACNSNSPVAEADHAHDAAGNHLAELEALAYTLYTNKTELFVEFKPLVVGTESRFAAHFTALGDLFKAIGKGTIKLSLVGQGTSQSITATAPEVPGIFRLRITPEKAGDYQLVFDIQTPTYTDQIIIENVKVYPDEKTAIAQQPAASGGGSDITYLKEQAWKVEFANAPAQIEPFSEVIRTGGQILAAPGDEAVITTQISGVISFIGKNFAPGSAIPAGMSLFMVKSNEVVQSNLGAEVTKAETDLATAKKNFERSGELIKDKIISEREFLEAQLRYENAQTQLKSVSVSRNFNQNRQRITAPMGGFLKNILVENGQFVNAGQPLATVSKNKKLLLRADVSQRYFPKLAAITAANFKTTDGDQVFNTRQLNGKVLSFGKTAAANSPFVPFTFEIDNVGNFIPGSVVEVFLQAASQPALVVPVTALLEEQGVFYVYVQTAGESFQKREVKISAADGLRVQILSGIAEGERVVTKGGYQIKLSTASGTLPAHGHEH